MSRLLDPTYDTGFKLLFGRQDVSEDILKEFLKSIFEGDSELEDIKSVRFLNTEKPAEITGVKGIRYDILCETESGHRFIVEMQKSWQPYFLKRAEYYYSRAIAEQGYKGTAENDEVWDYNFLPVIGVFICQATIKGLTEKLITKCRLVDEETGEPIGSTFRFVYIQLPCFTKDEAGCESYFDQWIYNLKNMGRMQQVAFSHQEVFRRLANVGNVSSLSPEERYNYEADLKLARDYHNQMKGAEILGFEQGHKEGLEQGIAKGLEQGIAEGRAEGRAEGALEKLRSIVIGMRVKGLDDDTISGLLGESPDLIKSL